MADERWRRQRRLAFVALVIAVPLYVLMGIYVGLLEAWDSWTSTWRKVRRG